MKYCKDCVGFDECKTTGRTVEFAVDDGVCIDFDERKPQTNADKIRSMTDEELAEFIKNVKVRAAFCKSIKNNDAFEELCSAEWLKQPSEPPKGE